jgi:hypothetical protein
VSGATLFRRNKPSWRFEWDRPAGMCIHRTIRGMVYAIAGIHESKPVWIARLHFNVWCTCERDIGADMIQFDDGSEFWFKGNPK